MKPIAIALTLWMLSGCATLIRGTDQNFSVATDPVGASVSTTLQDERGRELGCEPTPCSVTVPRRSQFVARLDKPGYQSVRIIVRSHGDRDALALTSLGNQTAGTGAMAAYGAATTSGTLVSGIAGGIALVGVAATAVGAPIMFIDASTGALSTIYPNPINLNLTPMQEGMSQAQMIDPDELEIVSMQEP